MTADDARPVLDRDCEVAVVGGGLAGLTAARRLARNEVTVAVLEARDRVGGRTLSRDLAGETIDLGAQWIGPGQRHVHALVEEFGVETFPQYTAGESAFRAGGTVGRHETAFGALDRPAQWELRYAIWRLDEQSESVPVDAPHEAPEAAAWDSQTVATWRDATLRTAAARDAFDAMVRAVFGSEPRELSLLFLLFYVASAGGFGPLTSVEGGAQQTRLVGGTQQLAEELAAALGDRVHLGTPVHAIEQGDGVTVHAEGLSLTAEYAVVAVPPALAGRIDYDPPLPARRDGLTQRPPMGEMIKCVAAYDAPFWRHDGRSGEVVDADGPVGLIYDDLPREASTGALVGFVLGDHARDLAAVDAAERRDRVLDQFAAYLGPRAADPVDYVDQVWANERYSRACLAGNMPPGALTSHGAALREPCGRLHWAGTETATEWYGYMDGAVSSGERAASEVRERLE
ncbi:MAG: flavin monoamine oxidase family protein [Haloplanus sp.]